MKTTLTILSFLIIQCYSSSARAQKAYETISYRAIIYGNPVTLQLADGYLLASQVTIHSKFGEQVFSPSADEPDAHGDLRFEAGKSTGRYKDSKGAWLTLKKMIRSKYPSQIDAVYWDGKMQKTVIFKKR